MSNADDKQTRKIDDLRLILKDFLKVIKIVAMYPEDNPLPQSLRRTFAERLVDLVEDFGQLDFRVMRDTVRYETEAVFVDKTGDERLAGMFFDTGINRLAFRPGIEVDDIYRLLEAIKQYQNADRNSRDLAAQLWEADIRNFGFETVEDVELGRYDGNVLNRDSRDDNDRFVPIAVDEVDTYNTIFSEGDESDAFNDSDPALETAYIGSDSSDIDLSDVSSVLSTGDEARDAALNISASVEAMGLLDANPEVRLPDTKLILNDELRLSDEESDHVEQIRRSDADYELYESTTEIVKEILHQEDEMADFNDSVTIGEKVLMEFVAHGKLTFAADLLRYFSQLESQIKSEKPLWSERLKEARISCGGRERLTALRDSLNGYENIGAHELNRYLDNFDWEALMPITDLLGTLEHAHHISAVRDFLTNRGRDRIPIVARALEDKSPEAAQAAVTVLAGIGTDEALKYLSRTVEHKFEEVRHTLANALSDCPSEGSLPLLVRFVSDDSARIRATAVAAIVSRGGQPAFDALTELINDDQFQRLTEDEQRSILVAYSRIGGDSAVEYLLRLADDVSLFGSSGNDFLRQTAFDALAHNRGLKAEQALLKRCGSWRGQVKALAKAALQQRREMLYGETDD